MTRSPEQGVALVGWDKEGERKVPTQAKVGHGDGGGDIWPTRPEHRCDVYQAASSSYAPRGRRLPRPALSMAQDSSRRLHPNRASSRPRRSRASWSTLGAAFLPTGGCGSERPGRLWIVWATHILPGPGRRPACRDSQGGLLDVTLDPLSPQHMSISLCRAREVHGELHGRADGLRKPGSNRCGIYRQEPKLKRRPFGSRIVFGTDGTLFVTQGDRQDYREKAQDLLRSREDRQDQSRGAVPPK